MNENNYSEENNTSRRRARALLLVLAILLIMAGSAYFGYYLYTQYAAQQDTDNVSVIAQTTQAVDDELAVNPIDFKSLRHKNGDIYAWLKVPGTKVDYPIVQHPEDDDFYLKHSAYDKSWKASGAVYTELGNTNTFDDRVTVVYGHNGYGDTMFTTLHRFEEQDFFKKHGKFYIYMPHRKLTYQIVSAFKFDDRHLLNCFDFNDTQVFADFLQMLQAPETNNANVRQSLQAEMNTNDKIVVLSTCFTNQRSNRYLVCGVLIKDEKTN